MSAGKLSRINIALYAKVKSLKKKSCQNNDNHALSFWVFQTFFASKWRAFF
jgi:hypothetical protein